MDKKNVNFKRMFILYIKLKEINNSQYKAPAFLRFVFQCSNVALKFKYQGTDKNKINKR